MKIKANNNKTVVSKKKTTITKPVQVVQTRELVPVKAVKPKIPESIVHNVCGLTDPFCEHARGTKYPDSSSVKTLPFTSHFRRTLVSDASGFANAAFLPQYSTNAYVTSFTAVGNSVTAWNAFTASTPIAGVNGYRIVSAGVKIRHIVSPLNSAGMIYIRQFPSETAASLDVVDTTTYNCSSSLDVAVQDAKEVCCILQHTSQMPQVFYNVVGDNLSWANISMKGFTLLTIGISGAPASTPMLDLEFFVHYELAFDDNTALGQVATPSVSASPVLTAAASAVTSTIVPMVNKSAEAFGKALFNKALTAVASYYAGPYAGAAANMLAITVD